MTTPYIKKKILPIAGLSIITERNFRCSLRCSKIRMVAYKGPLLHFDPPHYGGPLSTLGVNH